MSRPPSNRFYFMPACDINKLKPYEKQARKNEKAVDAVFRSIEMFGFNAPIIVDPKYRICAGHTRLRAAQQAGKDTVPVLMIRDLTGDKFTGYHIADNQTGTIAKWDDKRLAELITELQGGGFDIDSLGFMPAELQAIMVRAAELDTTGNEDVIPDPPKKPITKRGDLWKLGDHRLLCGSATNATDVKRLLSGAVPFIMVTDPPYGVDYTPDWRNKLGWKAARATGKVANDHRADWHEAWDLFPGSVCYVWHGALHVSTVAQSLEAHGFIIRAQIIWVKQMAPISRGAYRWQHEPCFYAIRKGAAVKFIADRSQTTVWQIANLNTVGRGVRDQADSDKTGHGTQKPVECMLRPIRNHGNATDSVYDPFVGSGTTLIAAEKLGRRCYSMEIEPEYCDVVVKRWEHFTGRKAKRG